MGTTGDPSGLAGLPLVPGADGEAVRDLQRRLSAAGIAVPSTEAGHFGEATALAVLRFQQQRGLTADGICGRHTWSALVEAGFHLGDRLLYLRNPMLRGDDVAVLQRRLGALGFDAGRVDGIFGPQTEQALREFQRNCAITTDGVCGPEVLSALRRLGAKADAEGGVARVRERLRLSASPRELTDRRIVVGDLGGMGALVSATSNLLHRGGARVVAVDHPDPSAQAKQANEFAADVYLGLAAGEAPCRVAYYATEGFESIGGCRLAQLVAEGLAGEGLPTLDPRGMRLDALRETRMPAVQLHLGPTSQVVAELAALATVLAEAITAWVHEPLDT